MDIHPYCVYAAKRLDEDRNIVKIGYTSNIYSRLLQIRSNVNAPILLINVRPFSYKSCAIKFESICKYALRDFRSGEYSSEWFHTCLYGSSKEESNIIPRMINGLKKKFMFREHITNEEMKHHLLDMFFFTCSLFGVAGSKSYAEKLLTSNKKLSEFINFNLVLDQ